MDDVLKMVLAYGIIMFGPPIATYMYIKNSNKLIAAASNAVSKAGAKLGGFIGSSQQKKFKRSAAGVAWNDRERALDNQGLTEGRDKINKLFAKPDPTKPQPNWLQRRGRSAATGLITRGMNDRTKRNFTAQLAGQDNEIYRGEVSAYKTQLGREFSKKETAQPHYWERMQADDLSAAESHALHDHMLSFDGGASWVDKVWTGETLDESGHNIGYHIRENKRKGGDALTGVVRSLLDDSSKFKGGSADASYALTNYPEGYVNELANSDGKTAVGTNRPVDKFLGKEWTQFEYQTDPATGKWLRNEDNIPIPVTVPNPDPTKDPIKVPKKVVFTDLDGNTIEKVLVKNDPNGGLDYTGERAKNQMGMGSRLAIDQATSGLMTDEAARAIIDSPTSTERERLVRTSAERRLALIAKEGHAINPGHLDDDGF